MPKSQNRSLAETSFTGDLPKVPKNIISFDRQLVDTRGDRWLLRKIADGGDLIGINWRQFASLSGRQTEPEVPIRTVHIARLYASDRLTRKAATTVDNDLYALHLLLEWLYKREQSTAHTLQWAAISESDIRGFLEHILPTPNRGNDFHRVRGF